MKSYIPIGIFLVTIFVCGIMFTANSVSKQKQEDAYKYGISCAKIGVSTNANPYRSKAERQAWLDGWYAGKIDN